MQIRPSPTAARDRTGILHHEDHEEHEGHEVGAIHESAYPEIRGEMYLDSVT
jgi:hypothetical protein